VFAFEKLPGLPRERVLGAIEPVLRAHGLTGVEVIWRMDDGGRVLEVTLERAGSPANESPANESSANESSANGSAEGEAVAAGEPGPSAPGVTLEECSRVSRDLSTALDVAQAIDRHYRLQVGSPGLDRRLYGEGDYRRFSGEQIKMKVQEPVAGQHVLVGELRGLDDAGSVRIFADGVEHAIPVAAVRSAQLFVDWAKYGFAPAPPRQTSRRGAASFSKPSRRK
jgi:ribosome maturation factor RimP